MIEVWILTVMLYSKQPDSNVVNRKPEQIITEQFTGENVRKRCNKELQAAAKIYKNRSVIMSCKQGS